MLYRFRGTGIQEQCDYRTLAQLGVSHAALPRGPPGPPSLGGSLPWLVAGGFSSWPRRPVHRSAGASASWRASLGGHTVTSVTSYELHLSALLSGKDNSRV